VPDRTLCQFCGKVGFVRRERVLKGGRSIESFYCGSCNRSWDIEDKPRDHIANRRRDDKPPRA